MQAVSGRQLTKVSVQIIGIFVVDVFCFFCGTSFVDIDRFQGHCSISVKLSDQVLCSNHIASIHGSSIDFCFFNVFKMDQVWHLHIRIVSEHLLFCSCWFCVLQFLF